MMPTGLDELVAQARGDFARLNFPAPNWVPALTGPDGQTMLDVLVIGAGLCGQTAGFALARDGVRNVRIIDRAERGREGPWDTYARMDTLRSPKQLTGPDLGFPALTFRAWYEAQHGADGWHRLYKVATKDWLDYLLWVRDTVGLSIENNTEVTRLDPKPDGVRVELVGPAGERSLFARKVVLAGGRDGSGAVYRPSFPSLAGDSRGQFARVFHASDDINFARFEGGKIGVLGASASAFDNAAVALEAGAAEAHLFVRRAHLPQINKSKWTAFAGFFLGFRQLDDRTRWRIYSYKLHLCAGGTAAARVGAALRSPCRFQRAFRRTMARRGGRTCGCRGRHGQSALCLRCGHHGDWILRRSPSAPRIGSLPR